MNGDAYLTFSRGVAAPDVYSIDQPCPTITAAGMRKSTAEIVMPAPYLARRGGFNLERTFTIDRPAPCVQAEGIDGSADNQMEIVMPGAYLNSSKKKGHSIRMNHGLDEPSPCITTEGLGAERAHYAEIVEGTMAPPITDPNKPPYHRPTLAEILALGTHGLTHVSTFSGGGGTCLGFKMAGFTTLWANDVDPTAQQTYETNLPDVSLDRRDIRVITAADILAATGLKKGELDVFEGSPPCTAFSTAGKREDGWNQTKTHAGVSQDNIEDLFFDWIRLLEGLQPKIGVAENVVGLTMGAAKGIYNAIVKAIKAAGYNVSAQVLDAQWLGVPQTRSRVIFVAVRKDLKIPPPFPTPEKFQYSIRDACPHLSAVITDPAGINAKPLAKAKHAAQVRTGPAAATRVQGSAHDIAVEAGHFAVRRPITIDEVRAICSFPDDYWLPKSRTKAWGRLGNSVPPLMAFRIARAIALALGQRGPFISLS